MDKNSYEKKRQEHDEKVTEAITSVNLILSLTPPMHAINARVKRMSGVDIRETESQWINNPKRKVFWSWSDIFSKKKKKIRRLAVSFHAEHYKKSMLCGMMFCSSSRHAVNVNIRYLEGHPDSWHPLKESIMDIALMTVHEYSKIIKAKKMTIQNPIIEVVDKYIDRGYELNDADKRRKNKGLVPLLKTLEKIV